MSMRLVRAVLFYSASTLVASQSPPVASVETNVFNSTFQLSQDQISLGNLSQAEADSLDVIINYDKTVLAHGGTTQDDFYSLSSDMALPTKPGVLLKTQAFTNSSQFTLPSFTALSRIIYTTTNLNGTVVPTSAFILWPFSPRTFPSVTDGLPVVLWQHGTSGFFADAAPSTRRDLYYQFTSVFPAVLDGYAVVATDYAGLGYNKNLTGNSTIPHQYLASPASAHDALYALQAARDAFPGMLSHKFVSMGQSQGGGVAWALSQVVSKTPSLGPGFLGSIAVSPVTSIFTAAANEIGPFVGMAVPSVFPDFKLSEWLTPLGLRRVQLYQQLQGSLETGIYLFTLPGGDIVKPGYNLTSAAKAYGKLSNAGSAPVKGPLLVIHGSADPVVPFQSTVDTVNQTCQAYPDNQLSFLVSEGTGHVPTLDSTRRIWMDWIADRFNGVALPPSDCGNRTTLKSFLPLQQYQPTYNSVLQWIGAPQFSYENVLAV